MAKSKEDPLLVKNPKLKCSLKMAQNWSQTYLNEVAWKDLGQSKLRAWIQLDRSKLGPWSQPFVQNQGLEVSWADQN